MIEELDVVALTRDISGTYLQKGDMGTVVLVYGECEGFMVEFLLQAGFAAALEDVKAGDVRPLKKSEVEQRKYREWKSEWTEFVGLRSSHFGNCRSGMPIGTSLVRTLTIWPTLTAWKVRYDSDVCNWNCGAR